MMIPRQRSRRILLHRINYRETQAFLTRGAGGGWQPNEVEGTNDDADLRFQRRKSARDDGGQGPGDDDNDGVSDDNDPFEGEENEEEFLRRELAHLASLEELLSELDIDDENQDAEEGLDDDDFLFGDDDDNNDVEDPVSFLSELLESIDDDEEEEMEKIVPEHRRATANEGGAPSNAGSPTKRTMSALETALMQGVVPVGAGVGDDSLPGDFGFDPLRLSERDLVLPVQTALLKMLPGGGPRDESGQTTAGDDNTHSPPRTQRPRALLLRDYREAEIRHSRLAMLAAMIWPLQEMLDRLLLDEDLYGPLLYGPVTLPYFPLLMTAILLLLGYLDIYSMAIKEMDDIGEAYLPGDCFWDPLRILAGTAPDTKRRMQERELFNGRAAMLAVAAFVWEELVTGLPVIEVEGNELLFQPLYQVPFVQSFLDAQFSR
jgi:light-harvesting complex I chlorophyll a/b binding protein 1